MKVAVAILLLLYPLAAPIAFSVSVEATAIGPVYNGDAVVGAVPLVV